MTGATQIEETSERREQIGPVSAGGRSRMFTRRPRVARWVLVGPVTVVLAVLVMMGMSLWVPAGPAGIDNIAMPVILFPLIWAGLFFYALLEERMERAVLVFLGLLLAHIGRLAFSMG